MAKAPPDGYTLLLTAAGLSVVPAFQEDLPYGRILHLQPVTWHDGWPVIGVDADGNGIGEPVLPRYERIAFEKSWCRRRVSRWPPSSAPDIHCSMR